MKLQDHQSQVIDAIRDLQVVESFLNNIQDALTLRIAQNFEEEVAFALFKTVMVQLPEAIRILTARVNELQHDHLAPKKKEVQQ